MIRHSIVSDAYNISQLKRLEEMGHYSVGTAMGAKMRKRNELQTSFRFLAENENCFRGEQAFFLRKGWTVCWFEVSRWPN